MDSKQIDFYFDYISPYAFLAWFGLKKLCDTRSLQLRANPVVFGALLDHFGQLGPAEISPKREYVFKNAFRLAKLRGFTLTGPRFHPFNPLQALRVSLLEVAGEDQNQVIETLWRAIWIQGIDAGTSDELATALTAAGFDGKAMLEKTKNPLVKEQLKQSTSEAIARGVFGVPIIIVGEELFWGFDSLPHLELFLDDQDPLDRERINDFLDRPRGIDRKKI